MANSGGKIILDVPIAVPGITNDLKLVANNADAKAMMISTQQDINCISNSSATISSWLSITLPYGMLSNYNAILNYTATSSNGMNSLGPSILTNASLTTVLNNFVFDSTKLQAYYIPVTGVVMGLAASSKDTSVSPNMTYYYWCCYEIKLVKIVYESNQWLLDLYCNHLYSRTITPSDDVSSYGGVGVIYNSSPSKQFHVYRYKNVSCRPYYMLDYSDISAMNAVYSKATHTHTGSNITDLSAIIVSAIDLHKVNDSHGSVLDPNHGYHLGQDSYSTDPRTLMGS